MKAMIIKTASLTFSPKLIEQTLKLENNLIVDNTSKNDVFGNLYVPNITGKLPAFKDLHKMFVL